MIDFKWMEKFPGKNMDGVMEFLESFSLGMATGQQGKRWWVATGEKVLLETDDKEVADAFLMGMAIAYLALPQTITDEIRDAFSA